MPKGRYTDGERSLTRQPILTTQAIDAGEFFQIAGDEFEAKAARMASDEKVVGADDIAFSG